MSGKRAGLVSIVGAGPGDPGLITVLGRERLRRADAVVYDHLLHPDLLKQAPIGARRIYVGKRAGVHVLAQDKINRLLIRLARRGLNIVRLKGGDPYVFGRGGEEALCLARHGIPFEIIPGVTAGLGAAAYAGIPVTHREHASSVTFVTGHEATDKPDARGVDWEALARLRGTLVFYMGVRTLGETCRRLIAHGRPAATPTAAVAWATWPRQRTVRGTLATLPQRAKTAGLESPAVVIVGEVAEPGHDLAWYARLPLFGRRVLVTRTREQAGEMARRLHELGAEPIEVPVIRLAPPRTWAPVDRAIRSLNRYDWLIFASRNAVDRFIGRLHFKLGRDARSLGRIRIAAIGKGTAHQLEGWFIRPDHVAGEATSEGLLRGLLRKGVRRSRILFPRTDRGRDVLPTGLRRAGAAVDEVTVYRTLPAPKDEKRRAREALRSGRIDAVTFASSETVRNFVAAAGRDAIRESQRKIVWASIGPATSATMREMALPVTVQAREPSLEALVEAVSKRLNQVRKSKFEVRTKRQMTKDKRQTRKAKD